MRAGEEPTIPDAEIDVRAQVGPGHEIALFRSVREEDDARHAVRTAVVSHRRADGEHRARRVPRLRCDQLDLRACAVEAAGGPKEIRREAMARVREMHIIEAP